SRSSPMAPTPGWGRHEREEPPRRYAEGRGVTERGTAAGHAQGVLHEREEPPRRQERLVSRRLGSVEVQGQGGFDMTVSAHLARPLVDSFGRVHKDLRISLTDVCNLRCTYCMPAEGVPWLARENILTTPELVRVARVAAALGIVEARLTGGEPLLRRDAVDVVREMAAIEGDEGPLEISMTTNALRLVKL